MKPPKKFEDQPWYLEWKQSIDKVVATKLTLDATQPNTAEREAAEHEYEHALATHHALADRLR
jgi:hypothetical protein